MKKPLQIVLVASLLFSSSNGVLLASDAGCRVWLAAAATETAQTVLTEKRHYSKKVLAAWAHWRAQHPSAKPALKRPASPVLAQVPDSPGFNCDAMSAASVSETRDTIDTPLTPVDQPIFTEQATDVDFPPATPDTLIADGPSPSPLTSVPLFSAPPAFSSPVIPGPPPLTGTPPVVLPPLGNPPTTGSSVPPPPPPDIPTAVAAEPSSLVLLGTGIVALAGASRRRTRLQ